MPIDLHVLQAIGVLLVLLLVDWGLGVVPTILDRTFSVQDFPRQAETAILRGLGASGLVALFQTALSASGSGLSGPSTAAVYAVVASFTARAVADIRKKLLVLLGQAPAA